ncbi:MarR family winged helix-turn-helix transcriptional regulator [Lentibacillus saliphilus]|uniref:MarR family winged helix-turn-helix transcriptional regulator n=1 Tax=Lentibacillus saliphilus TaxID=2737028 RepID=UPI001C30DB60|nr:MarR family transcriptional regulator [Lentibacillus saliphilus]
MYECNNQPGRSMDILQSFWRLKKAIMAQVKQIAHNHELSVPQFGILITMSHKGKITQKTLQERTHFPKSTLSHAIDGLVLNGYLMRTPVEGNRREMDLSLSEAGHQLIKDIQSQPDSVHTRLTHAVNSFSEEQFNALIDMHQHIAAYLEDGDIQ